jgi:hypothetical protein
MVSFMISRYGDYILEGVNVQSSLAGNQLALDITGLYNPGTQAIEAGLGLHKEIGLLHNLETWLKDVVELAWVQNSILEESYWYAAGLGLVAWRNRWGNESYVVECIPQGSQPDNVREPLPCLSE